MYLVPTDDAFIEEVAKSIARNRIYNDATNTFQQLIGRPIDESIGIEDTFDKIFETLWSRPAAEDEQQRQHYRSDALAAIRMINLKLMTTANKE